MGKSNPKIIQPIKKDRIKSKLLDRIKEKESKRELTILDDNVEDIED